PSAVSTLVQAIVSSVLFSLCLFCGCTGPKQARMAPATPPPVWLWPSDEPGAPRITYVQSITRPADAGVRVSGLRRFTRLLTGADKGGQPLLKPFGVALDENENLCITDTAANAVAFLDRAQK